MLSACTSQPPQPIKYSHTFGTPGNGLLLCFGKNLLFLAVYYAEVYFSNCNSFFQSSLIVTWFLVPQKVSQVKANCSNRAKIK